MTGEVINLRQARKRRDRKTRETKAEISRYEHGRSKGERVLAGAINLKAVRIHDAGRLEAEASGAGSSAGSGHTPVPRKPDQESSDRGNVGDKEDGA